MARYAGGVQSTVDELLSGTGAVLQTLRETAVPVPLPYTAQQLKAHFQEARDRAALNALPYVAIVAAGYALLLWVGYAVWRPGLPGWVTAVHAATILSSLLLFAARRRGLWAARLAHAGNALLLGLLQLNGLALLLASGDLAQTAHLLLVPVLAGLAVLAPHWLVAVMGLGLIGWLAMLPRFLPAPLLLPFGLAQLLGVIVAGALSALRYRSVRQQARLRLTRQEITRQLRHATQQSEISIAIGQRITSILDLDALLEQVVELIRAQYGFYFVGVFLLNEDGSLLVPQAGTGGLGHQLRARAFSLRIGLDGIAGWVAARRRYAHVPDVTRDARFLMLEEAPATRSELDLPIIFGGTLMGVLSLQSDRLGAFEPADIPFLHLLADQVAIAIHNARTYARERVARQLAETLQETGRALNSTLDWAEVLDRILAELANIVTYERASVLVPRDGELVMVAARGFPADTPEVRISLDRDDESIFAEIYETQRPLPIADVAERPDWQQVATLPQTRSWLGVPLIRGGQVIGMLSLAREVVRPYAAAEIALAAAFADQAATALNNARLYDQVNAFNRQLEYEVRRRTVAIQEAYAQLERLDRTKSDFIQIVAHELRTPLTLLRGYSQMLLSDPEVAAHEYARDLVQGMFSGANRLHDIVNSMIDMVKIDSRALQLYPEPVEIEALLNEVIRPLAGALTERRLALTAEAIRGLPGIEADPEALQKVFLHLLINAIKFTPDGGKITISGRVVPPETAELPAGGVEIVFQDTGIGIDPALRDLIFNKFYQTGKVNLHSTGKTKFKGGGPGLGLTIARGIVEAHHGKLWAESPGYDEITCPGSRFHVLLPREQPG
ncbi:MAG: GAF domain-containing protein [Anaerolineales bacterium]|nr:GAF domain-containing protein [Anaerolineales bacterium]